MYVTLYFSKMLKPILSLLRHQGILCVNYLDDFIILSNTKDNCAKSTAYVIDMLKNLGFVINEKKSSLSPSRICTFLGFVYDTTSMTLQLPNEKKNKILKVVQQFKTKNYCKIRDFAELIGMLISACPAVEYGWCHTKMFERAKVLALKKSKGRYSSLTKLSPFLQEDFNWWLVIPTSFSKVKTYNFQFEIFSDASNIAWGGVP